MSIVEWEDKFNIGIHQIDKHHRHLIELLNMAYKAIIELQDKNQVRYLFHELLSYADYHFSAEEELMRSVGYHKLVPHMTEHEKFKAHLNGFLDKFLASEEIYNVEVVFFLEEWLLNHILLTDKEFAPAVKARTVG
ncbi:hemerythrin family protein [Geobacter pelophilus]|uniref:Hemerythrin family protein n=1 Tax=Geoanaerobacter pelophilus TaxID=60036 RepID=A0AAW4L0P7_9BACT|nr:bacteriohemerythrin [Geoanaerobacter pelophilus]MBT0664259.1 hemerythrin family protein [Geoanaerobacter pelophilus]